MMTSREYPWVVCALLICASHAVAGGDDGQWVTLGPMSLARQETGAARIGENVYVAGGLLSNFTATTSVEVFEPASNLGRGAWSSSAPMPEPRDHAAVVALDGNLHVIGGYAGDFAAKASMFIYSPQQNQWTTGASLPEPRGACWAVTHEGRIYLFGGVDAVGAVRNTTYIFDPQSNQWTLGANMPTAREHLNAAIVGEHIYVIGGRSGASTNANHRYHPASNTWQEMAPMPTARSATGCAAFGRRIIVAGGEIPTLFAVNEIYDTALNSWMTAASMPVPRHGIAAVTLDDRGVPNREGRRGDRLGSPVLMPAGGTVQGLQPTTHVDAFIPPPLAGDVTGDGFVNVDDLLGVISQWGPCPAPPALCPADVAPPGAPDGMVNVDDLLLTILNWG